LGRLLLQERKKEKEGTFWKKSLPPSLTRKRERLLRDSQLPEEPSKKEKRQETLSQSAERRKVPSKPSFRKRGAYFKTVEKGKKKGREESWHFLVKPKGGERIPYFMFTKEKGKKK